VVPTFSGRLQTRLLSQFFVALPWMLLMSLVLAPLAGGLQPMLRAALFTWAAALVVGLVVWEPLYHGLMQFRWEKDWPTPFLLLQSVPEAAVAWILLRTVGPGAPLTAFVILYFTAWLAVFLTLQGPLRVLSLRWRFRGGRLL
jgi:hypothetical protein